MDIQNVPNDTLCVEWNSSISTQLYWIFPYYHSTIKKLWVFLTSGFGVGIEYTIYIYIYSQCVYERHSPPENIQNRGCSGGWMPLVSTLHGWEHGECVLMTNWWLGVGHPSLAESTFCKVSILCQEFSKLEVAGFDSHRGASSNFSACPRGDTHSPAQSNISHYLMRKPFRFTVKRFANWILAVFSTNQL
jgi:hypothetical protein